MSFGNSDRAVYSDLNPLDGGQSLYPMSTVIVESIGYSDLKTDDGRYCNTKKNGGRYSQGRYLCTDGGPSRGLRSL